MRPACIGLLLAVALAAAAEPDETPRPADTEEAVDAEIRDIEKSVSGDGEVEEFVPKKPLSADKAIALPSDI